MTNANTLTQEEATQNYLDRRLILLEPYTEYKRGHNVECIKCKGVFVTSLSYKSKCPHCVINARKQETIALYNSMGLELLEDFTPKASNYNGQLKTRCLSKGHEFLKSYKKVVYNKEGCPFCTKPNSNKVLKATFKDRLKEVGWNYVSGEYVNNNSKVVVTCEKGHLSERAYDCFISESYLGKLRGCKQCYLDSRQWNSERIAEYLKKQNKQISLIFFDCEQKIATLECQIDKYKWDTIWKNFINNKSGCPKCAGNLQITPSETVTFFELAGYFVLEAPIQTNTHTVVPLKCSKGHQFKTNVYTMSVFGRGCPTCKRGMQKSSREVEISFYFKSAGFEINNHYKFGSFDIDIFIPVLNLGIEYNGVFYHALKENTYHLRKYKEALKHGITLIQIFEDDFECNTRYWLDYLLSRTSMYNDHCANSKFVQLEGETIPIYGMCNFIPAGHNFKKTLELLLETTKKPFIYKSDNMLSEDAILETNGGIKIKEIDPEWFYLKDGLRYDKELIKSKMVLHDAGNTLWLFKENDNPTTKFLKTCKELGGQSSSKSIHFENFDVIIDEPTKVDKPTIFLTENEILNKFKTAVSIIKAELGLSKRIAATQCIFKKISYRMYLPFLRNNSLFNTCYGDGYGLFFNDDLVQCVVVYNKKKPFANICQLCTKNDFIVDGGLTELLLHIETRPLIAIPEGRLLEAESYIMAGFSLVGDQLQIS